MSKSRYPTYDLWYDKLTEAMQAATMIPSFSAFTPRWCETIELKKNAAGSYTATVTDDNEVLNDYNFSAKQRERHHLHTAGQQPDHHSHGCGGQDSDHGKDLLCHRQCV